MATNIPLTPEQLARLAEIQAQAAIDADLEDHRNVEPGAPFYWQLMKAIAGLKAARVAAGLTLEQLAERTGLAVDTLSRLEAGRVPNPTWGTLGRYAVAVGRSVGLTVEPLPEPATPVARRRPTARTPDPQPLP